VAVIDTNTTVISSISASANGFNFYPNPAQDQIIVDLRAMPAGMITLNISSADGAIVYTSQINSALRLQPISTARLADGIYIIQLISLGQVMTKKLVVER
jgi:hypothetical protein